jgi:hypothetical protein
LVDKSKLDKDKMYQQGRARETDKRKREEDTYSYGHVDGQSNKKVLIGPSLNVNTKQSTIVAKPVTYSSAAVVTYSDRVEPSSPPNGPSTSSFAPQSMASGPMFYPLYPDPSLLAAAASTTPKAPPKNFPATVKVDEAKKKKYFRKAAGEAWEDPTLSDWPDDDFRIFCGDLGNEVHDEMLRNAFSKYPSLLKARVVRDKRTGKSKGYGFVSFTDPHDFVNALREMNGKYVGNRPMKLRKSRWKDRNDSDRMPHSSNKQK